MAQLTYNEASLAGDGCLEERGGGLTRFGRKLVAEMNRVGVGIDLSHCGDRTAFEAARASDKPVFLTHANAKAIDDRVRNKLDDTIRAVAETGGVMGVSIHGFMNWDGIPRTSADARQLRAPRAATWPISSASTTSASAPTSRHCATRPTRSAILDMSKNSYPETGGIFAAAFGNDVGGPLPAGNAHAAAVSAHPRRACATADSPRAEVDAIGGGNFLRAFRAVWG